MVDVLRVLCSSVLCSAMVAVCTAAEERTVDLGKASVGEFTHRVISLTNDSTLPWVVTGVVSSCECLQVLQYPAVLSPGAMEVVDLGWVPSSTGSFSYALSVLIQGTGQWDRVYMFAGEVTSDEGVRDRTNSVVALPSGIDQRLLQRRVHSRDAALYVSAVEAVAMARDISVTVVDVRPKTARDRCRVSSALEMDGRLIRTKPFLRGKSLLLLDSGWCSEETELLCRDLRREVFSSVAIVYGGVQMWRKVGGEVVCAAGNDNAVRAMASGDFWDGWGSRDWRVSVGSSKSTPMVEWLRRTTALGAGNGPNGEGIQILVDASPEDVKRAEGGTNPVFVVEGGSAALLERLVFLSQSRQRQTVTQSSTGTLSKGGCGSCR